MDGGRLGGRLGWTESRKQRRREGYDVPEDEDASRGGSTVMDCRPVLDARRPETAAVFATASRSVLA